MKERGEQPALRVPYYGYVLVASSVAAFHSHDTVALLLQVEEVNPNLNQRFKKRKSVPRPRNGGTAVEVIPNPLSLFLLSRRSLSSCSPPFRFSKQLYCKHHHSQLLAAKENFNRLEEKDGGAKVVIKNPPLPDNVAVEKPPQVKSVAIQKPQQPNNIAIEKPQQPDNVWSSRKRYKLKICPWRNSHNQMMWPPGHKERMCPYN